MNWISIAKLAQMKPSTESHGNLAYWESRDGIVYHQNRKIRKANVDTFEILMDEDSFLARDDKHIYHAWSLKKSIDRDSFEALGDFYYRDQNSAYAEFETSLKPLKGNDPDSFATLGCGYARDSSHGYFWGKPLRSCTSPMTLKVVESNDEKIMDYAMDSDFVYCESAALKNVDLDTWQPRVRGFSIDKNTVFYCNHSLAKVDPPSWQHITSCYSRDKNNVYHMARRIKKASPENWKLLDEDYSTDGENVYFGGKLIDDADAKTFRIKDGVPGDRNGEYDGATRSSTR